MVVCAFCGVSFLTYDALINDLACPQWNGEVTGHKKTAAGERCPRAIQRAAPAATAPKPKSTASKAKEKSAAAAPQVKAQEHGHSQEDDRKKEPGSKRQRVVSSRCQEAHQ